MRFYLDHAPQIAAEVGYVPLPQEGYEVALTQFHRGKGRHCIRRSNAARANDWGTFDQADHLLGRHLCYGFKLLAEQLPRPRFKTIPPVVHWGRSL